MRLLAIISLIPISLLLIYWWQTQIHALYIRRYRSMEIASLRLQVSQKEEEIFALKEQNEAMGRLLHKDNKLLPAMQMAVTDFLTESDSSDLSQRGQELLAQLESYSTQRQDLLRGLQHFDSKRYTSKIPELDTLLNYLNKRAASLNIEFSFQMAPTLRTRILSTISSEDLVHLLSNLIDNAFIAIGNRTLRFVRVHMYELNDVLYIEIADSGVPFEEANLMNFGLVSRTTHADTGGNGIGLLDIWDIKQNYQASLHVSEFEHTEPFSKKLIFVFDKKKRFIVYSFRAKELLLLQSRSDMQILELDTEEEQQNTPQ